MQKHFWNLAATTFLVVVVRHRMDAVVSRDKESVVIRRLLTLNHTITGFIRRNDSIMMLLEPRLLSKTGLGSVTFLKEEMPSFSRALQQ